MSDRLEPGYYVGHVQSWQLGENENTGNPQFVLTFTLAHRRRGRELIDCPHWNRSIFRVITDKTVEYFAADLRALGYDRDDFDGLDPDGPCPFDFEGIEIEASMKLEEYEGKTREKWDLAVVGGGAPKVKALEAGGTAKLNALFGGALKAAPPRLNRVRAPAPAPASDYDDGTAPPARSEQDDPIPF